MEYITQIAEFETIDEVNKFLAQNIYLQGFKIIRDFIQITKNNWTYILAYKTNKNYIESWTDNHEMKQAELQAQGEVEHEARARQQHQEEMSVEDLPF